MNGKQDACALGVWVNLASDGIVRPQTEKEWVARWLV